MKVWTLVCALWICVTGNAESYMHTVDKHPICQGEKISGSCSIDTNAVACSYWETDPYGESFKLYSICRYERYGGSPGYKWFHANYIPWRS